MSPLSLSRRNWRCYRYLFRSQRRERILEGRGHFCDLGSRSVFTNPTESASNSNVCLLPGLGEGGLRRWWASILAALGRAAGSGWTMSRIRLFSSREYSLRYSSSSRCILEYTGSSRLFLFKEKGALPKKAEQNFNLQSLHL
jgi:hypothetical protein